MEQIPSQVNSQLELADQLLSIDLPIPDSLSHAKDELHIKLLRLHGLGDLAAIFSGFFRFRQEQGTEAKFQPGGEVLSSTATKDSRNAAGKCSELCLKAVRE